jgi:hypothetical protein
VAARAAHRTLRQCAIAEVLLLPLHLLLLLLLSVAASVAVAAVAAVDVAIEHCYIEGC